MLYLRNNGMEQKRLYMATCPCCGNTHTSELIGVAICKNCKEKLKKELTKKILEHEEN